MTDKSITLRVSAREFHTILAALRFLQEQGQCELGNRWLRVETVATTPVRSGLSTLTKSTNFVNGSTPIEGEEDAAVSVRHDL